MTTTILDLPVEVLTAIITELPRDSVFPLFRTCKVLCNIAMQDSLWRRHLQHLVSYPLPLHVPERISYILAGVRIRSLEPKDINTWLELYRGLRHLWFILETRLWISDRHPAGELILTHFHLDTMRIHGYRLVAQQSSSIPKTFSPWEKDPPLVISSLEPVLTRKDKAFTLSHPGSLAEGEQDVLQDWIIIPRTNRSANPGYTYGFNDAWLPPEMYEDSAQRGYLIVLAKDLNPVAIDPLTKVWPPQTLPASGRARNPSRWDLYSNQYKSVDYYSQGYKPDKMCQRSLSAFRLIPDLPMATPTTYGAIPTIDPTARNPFIGIWVGDYTGHGNEFVAFLDKEENFLLPDRAMEAMQKCNWFKNATDVSVQTIESTGSSPQYGGGLLGVKLTGDSNVPCGEYTFIVPNLALTLRVAQEDPFQGAPVVGAVAHIAERGFRQDSYISAEMFLISPDRVAVYWEELDHISYFVRAKFDGFLKEKPDPHIDL